MSAMLARVDELLTEHFGHEVYTEGVVECTEECPACLVLAGLTEAPIVMTAHSLLDRLHEAHCCGEANGVAHGYALMDEVARDWIGEVLDRPTTRHRFTHAIGDRYNPTDAVIAAVKAALGVTEQ